MMSHAELTALLRLDFVSFMERAFYELNPRSELLMAPYIELMAQHLEDCRLGRIKRLVINIPPRHLKSHCASIAFVAWLLGHKPATQIICASYGQDLADKLALDCRKVMQSAWYQGLFATRLAVDRKGISDFMTTQQGVRMATSVGGVLTGRGADFIILDDPLKPEDALSEARREAVNNWYDSTLLSRLNDKTQGCIIVIMQRLQQDDLVGHILGQDDWTVLSFPAIAEVDEHYEIRSPLGSRQYTRLAGEPLHAERESLESLRATQNRIGDYNFSSQYQQNPIPAGGAIVKTHWLQYYDEPPPADEIRYRIHSWDTAVKTKEINDYSVCTVWAADKRERFYLLHVLRKRVDYPDLRKEVLRLKDEFRPNKILIEDKASGSSLIQELKRDGVLGIQAYEPPQGQDKTMRLYALTNLFEAGRVFLPKQAPWLHDYRSELTGFPGAKHDDQVDSTTQALDYLHNHHSSNLAMWAKLGR
jgi:predicted phage terminase large subunit-like protein